MKQMRQGYVVILAVMVIAALTTLVMAVLTRALVTSNLQRTLAHREQARLLALSGVEIARAQLSEASNRDSKERSQEADSVYFLKKVGAHLGTWQQFDLTAARDGIDGKISVFLASEAGKLNPNLFYDFEKQQLKKQPNVDVQSFLKKLGEKLGVRQTQLATVMSELFAQRKRPLDAVVQLFTEIGTGAKERIAQQIRGAGFYPQPQGKARTLSDVWTTETKVIGLQPWALSSALLEAFGVSVSKRSGTALGEALKKVKITGNEINWSQQWDSLIKPWWGVSYAQVPEELRKMLASEFETDIFSVVSYGKFGNVTVGAYVILQKAETRSQGQADASAPQKKMSDATTKSAAAQVKEYSVKKIYWI